MSQYFLTFTLKSDGAFGRGDGVAGFLNQEVQHDRYGCPYLGGKALKGILVNECADILSALDESMRPKWRDVANALFGQPSSDLSSQPQLHIGDACLPAELRHAIVEDIDSSNPSLTREDVVYSVSALRHQTAINDQTGVAKDNTLRTIRVVLRETLFSSPLLLTETGPYVDVDRMLMLLAATVKAFRRAGTARNRGLGRLYQVGLIDSNENHITDDYFEKFCVEVQS